MQKCKVNELVKLERTHKINKTNNKHTLFVRTKDDKVLILLYIQHNLHY